MVSFKVVIPLMFLIVGGLSFPLLIAGKWGVFSIIATTGGGMIAITSISAFLVTFTVGAFKMTSG